MKSFLRNLMQFIFLHILYKLAPRLMKFFMYKYLKSGIKLFSSTLPRDQKTFLNILVLNPERFMQDIESLTMVKGVNLLSLDSSIQYKLNSLFLPHNLSFKIDQYMNFNRHTKRLVECLADILKQAAIDFDIHCILSPSFQYRQDFPYQSAAKIAAINYFVIFKEYLKDPVIKNQFTTEYKIKQYKFLGSKMFLANQNLQEIMIDAGVANKDKLSVVGSPRIDNIYRKLMKENFTNITPTVTLFSFMHCSGGVRLNDPLEHFSYDPNDGFYNLFYETHKSLIGLALSNLHISFNIKLKYEGEWLKNIEQIALNEFKTNLASIPNLKVSAEGNVHDLMMASNLIISFNSTTVIETLLLQRPLLIPIFAEASGKYKDHVFFSKYLDRFNCAFSSQEFKLKIQDAIDSKFAHTQKTECPADMVKEYIDSFDGHSADKIINEIKEIVL